MADDDNYDMLIKSGLQSSIDNRTKTYLVKGDLPEKYLLLNKKFSAWQWGETFIRVCDAGGLLLTVRELSDWLKSGLVEEEVRKV